MVLASGMKNRYIWSIIDACGNVFLITLLVDSVYSVSPRGINELHHTKNTIQYPNPMIPCRRGSVVLF